MNVRSRAGAEISGGDLREGLEGFGLAVREKRGAEKRWLRSLCPRDEQPRLEGDLGTRGNFSPLKPAEHGGGLAGARVAQPAWEGCEDEAAGAELVPASCAWRQRWL